MLLFMNAEARGGVGFSALALSPPYALETGSPTESGARLGASNL